MRSKLDSNETAAADNFSRAIAKYAEKAYVVSSSVLLNRAANDQETSVSLKVTQMKCLYALDPKDQLVFLYTEYVSVEIDSGRAEIEDYLSQEKAARESSAAKAISIEMQNLLLHAKQRGLSTDQSFLHFDTMGNGFIDADQLIDGLARLGIGVTYPVAEAVLQIIGGIGANFVTMADFEKFLVGPVDVEAFEKVHTKKVNKTKKNSKTTGRSVANVSKASRLEEMSRISSADTFETSRSVATGTKKVVKQLLPPIKDFQATQASMDFMDIKASQQHDWKKLDETVPKVEYMELPLPEKAYNTGSNLSKTSDGMDLPTWARQRSHRALNQLRKARTSSSLSSASLNLNILEPSSSVVPSRQSSPPKSRASSRGKGSAGSKKSKAVQPLTLQSVAQDIDKNGTISSQDEFLHVDHGVIMTYRLLQGVGDRVENIKTHEKTDSLRYNSILELREKNLNALSSQNESTSRGDIEESDIAEISQALESTAASIDGPSGIAEEKSNSPNSRGNSKKDKKLSFTVVVVPDLFMTLDTLQQHFDPLLLRYPHAKIVLVGLPGLPHTVWPREWILNPDLHSRSIAKLLQHLQTTEQINSDPYLFEPVFFIGIGTSANCLSRFMCLFLPKLQAVEAQTRGICIVNGVLRFTKKFKKLCKDLRQSMLSSTPFEINELITSLHFWDEYLAVNGRDLCLDKFWSTRRSLRAINNSTEADHIFAAGNALGYFGILEQLKGILISPDDFDGALMLQSTDIPVIVVQSTEDVFVDPKTANMFQAESLPPERILVTDVHDSLDTNAVFINWLRAGHEVLQERNTFMLGLISNLAQMCGFQPIRETVIERVKAEKEAEEKALQQKAELEMFDVLDLASRRKQEQKRATEGKIEQERLEEEERQALLLQQEENEFITRKTLIAEEEAQMIARAREQEEATRKDEKDRLAAAESKAEAEEQRLEKERKSVEARKAAELSKRNQMVADRRKRELQATINAERQVFYQREQEEKDRKRELQEVIKMRKEDARSKFAADYQIECEIAEISAKLSKIKAQELERHRREEAIKVNEERKARERALRIEDRRRKAEEVIKQMEATELILAGMMEGGYDLPNDPPMHVIEVIDSTHRLMQDLMECRQKSVEAMKRQFMIFDKTVTFRKQVATLENEERRLRRAIRLVEINPAIVGDDLSAAAELDDLQRLLGEKQDALTELMSLANLKEGQLNAANRCVQQLKKISGERDSLMVQRLQDMLNIENVLSNRLKELKMKKESLIVQKDRQRIALIVSQKRVDQLNKEIIRVEGHSGEVIDTDVWVEGVLQRCRTLELKNHLANEMQMAEKKVQGIIEALDSIRHNIFDVTEIIAKIKRDSDKISSVYKLFYRTYHKFSAVPLSTIMKNLQQLQDKAEKIELRKAKEDDINKMFALAGSTSLVDKVRLKDSDIRTKDERQFVGIDLIMNPHAYIHLSPVEREQMHFDKDYHCTLAKADLDRILKLPEQINLALPFLHTEVEVNAHRLLNQFLRGKDEQFFKNRDYISEQGILAALREDSGEGLTDIDGNIMVIEEKDVQISEITHDILVRESLRDRVRSLGVDDKMTAEEFQWLQVDRILAPHMFTGEEVSTASEAPARNVEKSLVTNFTKKKLISRLMGKTTVVNEEHGNAAAKEGGIYDPIRQKFAEGEDVFLRTWSCPFTKAELNAIRCKPLHTLQGNDEVLVRKLMDKYYVDDNESTLGHNRLKILGKLANKMSKTVQMIDADSVENAINRKATFDEEELTFDRLTSMSNDPNKFMNHVMDTNIKRIWGSWEQVHPASAGKESQNSYFMLSTFDAARDHPAYYAVHDEQDDYLSDDDAVHELVNRNKLKSESIEAIQKDPAELEKEGLRVLTGNGDPPPVKNKGLDTNKNDPNSKFFITESITDLAQQDPRKVRGKIILLQNKEPMLLLQEKECKLPTRQSKSYYFTIPDRESTRILDITVSIIFQGEFGNNGYKLGRLAAALFRLPESKSSADTSMPIPVGFSPYALQCPNLSDKMGKVVITHKPKLRPIKPGSYQVVIGTAAATKFSIEVSCKYAQTALPLVDEAIQTAKQLQMRLPQCLAEISGVVESLRLTERKLLICDKLITEAEAETDRCQFAMQSIMAKLDRDDDEMTLMEEERRDLQRELNILEMEYTQWAGIYGSRNKEKDVIQEGIAMMYKFQKDRNEEKMKIKKDLEQYRRDLPPCIFILRTMVEATNVAAALNTTVQGVSDEAGAAATGDFGGIQVSTPADDIRRQLKQYGFSSLLLEEQQWCLLDQALNPHKYEWLREQEEREAAEREAVGKKPKETKFNPALEQYRYSYS